MVVVSIEKKKNQPEQKLASFSTSARADFSFFLLIHPSWFKMIGVFNRKKEKHPEQELVSFFKIIFNFDWMKNLSQQPEVGSKNRLRFWARGKILIKSKIFIFICHVYYHHYHHYHHHYHRYHHMSWYQNPDILHFINIFPRVQKRNPFFSQTFGCWDSSKFLKKIKNVRNLF